MTSSKQFILVCRDELELFLYSFDGTDNRYRELALYVNYYDCIKRNINNNCIMNDGKPGFEPMVGRRYRRKVPGL